jgi:hypothetical protein
LNLEELLIGESTDPGDPPAYLDIWRGSDVNVDGDMTIHPPGIVDLSVGAGALPATLRARNLLNHGAITSLSNPFIDVLETFSNAGELSLGSNAFVYAGTVDLDGPAGTGRFSTASNVQIQYQLQDGPDGGTWALSTDATLELIGGLEYRFSPDFQGTFASGATLTATELVVEGGDWTSTAGALQTATLAGLKVIDADATFNGRWLIGGLSTFIGGVFNGPTVITDKLTISNGDVTFNDAVEIQDVLVISGGNIHGAAVIELAHPDNRLELDNAQIVNPLRVSGITFQISGANMLQDAQFGQNVTYEDFPFTQLSVPVGGALSFAGGETVSLDFTYLVNAGELAFPDGDSALQLDGFIQESTGALRLQLRSSAQFDEVAVSETAALAGTLLIELTNSFVPGLGDEFEVLSAMAGITGAFTSEILPPLPSGLEWDLVYEPTAVTLKIVAAGATADFDGNGQVDADDLAEWQNDFGPAAGSDADGDGDSDGHDFLAWQRQLQAPAPSPSATIATVPEPSAAALACLTAIARASFRRRPHQSRWPV